MAAVDAMSAKAARTVAKAKYAPVGAAARGAFLRHLRA